MDDGPLDRLHQLVPPLEVTATAGVCVGLFALGRMIFRAPLVLTILGCVAFVGFAGIQQGLGLGQLWHLSLLVTIIIALIFIVGLFSTGQGLPPFGLLLLVVFTLDTWFKSPDASVPTPASSASGSHWILWLVGVVVIAGAGYIAYGFYVCHKMDKAQKDFERPAGLRS